jgi:hypothetical protein
MACARRCIANEQRLLTVSLAETLSSESGGRSRCRSGLSTIAALLVALAAPGLRLLNAQAPTPAPRVIGVFDGAGGAPLAGVQVTDLLTGSYATTSADGAATLGFIEFQRDSGLIELRKIGYTPRQVVVIRADRTPMTVLLDRFIELPTSVTTDTYRVDSDSGFREGFERRCTAAHVSCLRTADLARRPASSLGDIIGDTKGMLVGGCGQATRSASDSPSRPRGCRLLMQGRLARANPESS